MKFRLLDELTIDLVRSKTIRHDMQRFPADSHLNENVSIFSRLAALGLALGNTFDAALADREQLDKELLQDALIDLAAYTTMWIDVLNRCTCETAPRETCFRHRGSKVTAEPKFKVGTPVIVTATCAEKSLHHLTGVIKLVSTVGEITYYVVLDIDNTTIPVKENEIQSTISEAKEATSSQPKGCTCFDARGINEDKPYLIPTGKPCPVHQAEES